MTALPPDDELDTHEMRVFSGEAHLTPYLTKCTLLAAADLIDRLRAELSALRAEREPVAWAITFDSGACHITHDPTFAEECRAVKKASVQALYAAPQAHPGEESAAIPASDSTVPPGDGAAACKG